MDQLVQLRRLQLHIEQLVRSWSSSCALGRAVLPELGCAAPVLGAPVLAFVPLLRPGQLWKLRDGVLHHDDFLKTRLARKLSKREFTKWKFVPYFTPLFNNTLGVFLVYHSFGRLSIRSIATQRSTVPNQCLASYIFPLPFYATLASSPHRRQRRQT